MATGNRHQPELLIQYVPLCDRAGQYEQVNYAAAKSGIYGLTKALACGVIFLIEGAAGFIAGSTLDINGG